MQILLLNGLFKSSGKDENRIQEKVENIVLRLAKDKAFSTDLFSISFHRVFEVSRSSRHGSFMSLDVPKRKDAKKNFFYTFLEKLKFETLLYFHFINFA